MQTLAPRTPALMPALAIATALTMALCTAALAENIVFPPEIPVVDVKRDYGAKGDGKTDDTAAIQKAVDENKGKNRTLYFPNGTYLISDTVGITGGKAHSPDRFLTWQGQSQAGAIIKLADNAKGFDQPDKPKVVVSMYQGESTGDTMHGYVRNLTVDVGSGNSGAAGLRFMCNNTGGMYDVTIRSSDPKGAGAIGLDMRQSQCGPCLIKNVTVVGFARGVEAANTFSLVFEHLTLKDQTAAGFVNSYARTTIRDLKSHNRVTALTAGKDGQLTLVEAELKGGDSGAVAIRCDGPKVFLRDIRQSGYGHIVQDSAGKKQAGESLRQWHGGKAQALFDVPEPQTLRLPIEETPEVPWEEDFSKWIIIDDSKGADVTAALQDAIDAGAKEGKTTIAFKRGPKYSISGPIRVHGSINRIIGFSLLIDVKDPQGAMRKDTAVITFADLTSKVLVMERFFLFGGWGKPDVVMFDNASGKRIVLKNMGVSGRLKKPTPGGEWFLEDVAPSRESTLEVAKGEKVWARQFNPETPLVDMMHVDGGQLWVLGLKTEGRTRHIVAENGAAVELLGGVSYQSWAKQQLDPPMFVVKDSRASFTFGFYHYNDPFANIVEETLDGQTRTLARKDLKDYHLPVYRSGMK